MDKSPEAFRTISEVADWLGVPTHVLRFWESRFSQIKPVKRAGGRRYYRPSDMALIGGIKRLLHDDGMTIRGAQKLLREKGVKHVAALSQPLDGPQPERETIVTIESTAVEVETKTPEVTEETPREAAETEVEEAPAELPLILAGAQSDTEASGEEPPAPPDIPDLDAVGAEPETSVAEPDVPEEDPEDDDTAFPALPGLAARVLAADRGTLRQHRDVLQRVSDRLANRQSA